MRTLDASIYECCAAGTYLDELRRDVARMRSSGETWNVTNHSFEYVTGPVQLADGRAMLRTRETWSWDVIRGGVVVGRFPAKLFAQYYIVARVSGVVKIVEHAFE